MRLFQHLDGGFKLLLCQQQQPQIRQCAVVLGLGLQTMVVPLSGLIQAVLLVQGNGQQEHRLRLRRLIHNLYTQFLGRAKLALGDELAHLLDGLLNGQG